MAQRIIDGEQYEGVFVRGAVDGGPMPITGALQIPQHDWIGLAYSGSTLLQVDYKAGGASGETVASLVLSYDESLKLVSVAKV